MEKRIVIGLSGGVDSSVAAHLLKEQGYDVISVFLKMWTKDDTTPSCSQESDRKDAVKIAAQLDIPLKIVDREKIYRREILEHFYDEYARGRTPNPDILCNERIKFPALLNVADEIGVENVATGHYARIAGGELYKGLDETKDQSYFLHSLRREWLKRIIFPIGEMKKERVREIAAEQNLITSTKKDSQGLCFIGKIDLQSFLSKRLKPKRGKIVTVEGEVIGEHAGAYYYTIGQRRGIDVSSDEPYYVADRDIEKNKLIVVKGKYHPLLSKQELTATVQQWKEKYPKSCKAKIRYRQDDQQCTIERRSDDQYCVHFEKLQWAISAGQSVVFYDDSGRVLGGGIIEQRSCSETKSAIA